jgi:O-methyltransferase
MTTISSEFLTRLEDELLGLTRPHSVLQSLFTLRVPVTSTPKILRNVGLRGVVQSLKRAFVDSRPLYEEGRAAPPGGMTMIGRTRLRNLRYCIEQILRNRIPGDFIETGVWRGGATIYMRAVLKLYGANDRTVWVADSFRGIPPPDPQYPADENDVLHCCANLAVSQKQVESNFRAYGLLDENVRFLPGWFEDTLKAFPATSLALLRIDCDLYRSTIAVLSELYDRVSTGGYVIVDDYGAIPACRRAVEDFREANNIVDPIVPIDYTGVYWIKSRR